MTYLDEIAAASGGGTTLLGLLLRAATPATRIGMAWRLRQPAERVDATVISWQYHGGRHGQNPRRHRMRPGTDRAGRRVAVVTRGCAANAQFEPFVAPPDSRGPNRAAAG